MSSYLKNSPDGNVITIFYGEALGCSYQEKLLKPISMKCWPFSGENRDRHVGCVRMAVDVCVGILAEMVVALAVMVAAGTGGL